MVVKGLDTVQIANELNCTIAAIQIIRLRGLRANDVRALPTRSPLCAVPRPRLKVVYDKWNQEEDEQLHVYCEEGLTSSMIALRMNRSRNAIIGRVHRKGFQLKGNAGGRPSSKKSNGHG
jgi:hypothetical protein